MLVAHSLALQAHQRRHACQHRCAAPGTSPGAAAPAPPPQVGAATAFGAAALVKTRRFRSEHMPLESCLVTLLAFASYWLADGLRLSGIVSILFHGITGAHYVRPNLSQRSQDRVGSFFKLLACLAETSVFLFIGSSLFLDQQELSGARLLPFTVGPRLRQRAVWTAACAPATCLRAGWACPGKGTPLSPPPPSTAPAWPRPTTTHCFLTSA
jgi:hypothetical protein